MHGNVMEWVHDFKRDWTSTTVIDPTGPQSGGPRVVRGGSWSSFARDVRCAHRDPGSAGFELGHLSFRLVRVP
ncbi:MAG: formylglycine-generating enzyme family protein, partial [Planctomycetaceae bacterium]